jgi:hypothetical protein
MCGCIGSGFFCENSRKLYEIYGKYAKIATAILRIAVLALDKQVQVLLYYA